MKKLFNQREISRMLAISSGQIRYWDRIGLIPHVERGNGELWFNFRSLVAFRTLKKLLDQGIPLRKVRKGVEYWRKAMPEVDQPLCQLGIFAVGDQIAVCRNHMHLTPDGQLLMDFHRKECSLVPLPRDAAEDIFFEALEDEEEGDWDGARRKYETVLTLQAGHLNALVNMGNMFYRTGDVKSAEEYYRKALRIDPDQVEANYNLANLFEEKGDLENTILFYEKALHEDPEFADAHFNLARVLEMCGDLSGARVHWKRFLELDPSSEWRQLIEARLRDGTA